ncbi:MAG TPA: FkbM family methyltransferase [Bryobacteraceae bacterium]|nr:FkbM family methyltransferase [Bryobacteraceae bacterium]
MLMEDTIQKVAWRLRCAQSRVRNTFRIARQARRTFENWPYFWLSRFHRDIGTLILRNGLQFMIRPQASDRGSVTEAMILEVYGQVPEGAVVVDIGANIGAFSLLASRRAEVVYAVEPVRSNFEMLRQNVALNQLTNVIIYPLALADYNGTVRIRDSGVTSSMYFEGADHVELVPTVTLERFFNENGIDRVDYLKMDCEGAEWDILLSTPPEVLSRVRHLELEFHRFRIDKQHPQMLCNHLKSAGLESHTTNPDLFNGLLVAHQAS